MRWVIARGRWPRRDFRVVFFSANGERIMWSEGYRRKADARRAIEIVAQHAHTAVIDDETVKQP